MYARLATLACFGKRLHDHGHRMIIRDTSTQAKKFRWSLEDMEPLNCPFRQDSAPAQQLRAARADAGSGTPTPRLVESTPRSDSIAPLGSTVTNYGLYIRPAKTTRAGAQRARARQSEGRPWGAPMIRCLACLTFCLVFAGADTSINISSDILSAADPLLQSVIAGKPSPSSCCSPVNRAASIRSL